MKEKEFKKWEKNKIALSNEVYQKNNVVCKKYLENIFSEKYGNQEKIILKYLKDIEVISMENNCFCMKRIFHKEFHIDKVNNETIRNVAKKIKQLHQTIDISKIKDVHSPKFKETWNWMKKQDFIPEYKDENKIYEEAMAIVNDNNVLANNDIVDGNILITNDNKIVIIDYLNSFKWWVSNN